MDLTLCAAVVGQKRQPPLTHPQFRELSSRSAARDLLFTMVSPRSSQSATSPSRRGSSGHGFSCAVTPQGWGAALAAVGNCTRQNLILKKSAPRLPPQPPRRHILPQQ